MKDELIALLSDFKYPVYLQGSLSADEPYPPTFFTFWVNTSQDYSHYDNQPIGYVWTFDVNFYSEDPSLVNTVPAQAIDLLNEGKLDLDHKISHTFHYLDAQKDLEDSGTDVWKKDAFDAAGLKDAQLGIIFRREEHEYMNTRSWRTVPVWFRSVDSVRGGDFTVPEDKPLPQAVGTYEIPDSFSAAEDDIPF